MARLVISTKRRELKMELQHSVTVIHDGNWGDINEWLWANCTGYFGKNIAYPVTNRIDGVFVRERVTLEFELEQDALLFTLRWG